MALVTYSFLLLSSFTSLGTGRRTQEAEPVQGAYLYPIYISFEIVSTFLGSRTRLI